MTKRKDKLSVPERMGGTGRICTGPCKEFRLWSEFYKGNEYKCKICVKELEQEKKSRDNVNKDHCTLDNNLMRMFQ